jgi:hypothetical protein
MRGTVLVVSLIAAGPIDGRYTDPATPPSAGPVGGLSEEQLEAVVKMHRAALTRACWTGNDGGPRAAATETVHLVVASSGEVSSARTKGDDAIVGACLEREISSWVFPRTDTPTTVDLPFKFVNG